MKITKFLLTFFCSLGFGAPAFADKISLDEISAYFNAMTTLQAQFTQSSSDGTVQAGILMIKRPGKMRFEYAPPQEALVLSSNNAVAIFDGRSNSPPEIYPLRRTPLSIILARNVNLNRAKMVVGHEYDGQTTIVVAQDPEHPEYGTIRLKFSDSPVRLDEWEIVDGSGGQTSVVIGTRDTGLDLNRALFDIETERRKRER